MRTHSLHSLLFGAMALALGANGMHGQEQTIARGYAVMPKDGMVAQFEAALKAHIQWRAENGDPWSWSVSTVELGDNLGEYRIASFNHSWEDFDAYDAGFGPRGLMHWQATVAPLVKSVSSNIWTSDPDLALTPPEGSPPLAFVTITDFSLRPGREADFNETVASAVEILREHDFAGYGVWTSNISGGPTGPMVSLVAFHTSWADMAEPEPGFASIMVEALGEDGLQEWVDALGDTYRATRTYTLRLRPDLGLNQS